MNIREIFMTKQPKKVASPGNGAPAKPRKADPVERKILLDFHERLQAARQKVTDCEVAVQRLDVIVSRGETASKALQDAIAADGAASLASLVDGTSAPDTAMLASITAEVAARSAKEALPRAKAELEAAKADAMRVEAEHAIAAHNLMKAEANKVAAQYARTVGELCRLHDVLAGIGRALPPRTRDEQEIVRSTVQFHIPRFSLPACSSSAGGWSPTYTHHADEYRTGSATARWQAAFDRVLEDPDASVEDLIGEDIDLREAA
jgi:hypothetical protein